MADLADRGDPGDPCQAMICHTLSLMPHTHILMGPMPSVEQPCTEQVILTGVESVDTVESLFPLPTTTMS